MSKDSVAIDRAIEEIRAEYPFPEIIDETEDTIRTLAEALRHLAPSGSRLLDIGCGALDKATVYQKLGYVCYGCDDFVDPWHSRRENLDPVLAFANGVGVQVYTQREAFCIPWDEGSFDIVTIVNVIEHLHESPRKILNFAGTYLKPGGLLVVVMPNAVNLRKRLSVVMGQSNYTPARGLFEYDGIWRGHTREYTFRETCQIVEWAGLDVVYKRTFHGMLRSRLHNPFLRLLFKGLSMPAPSFRDGLLVVGRKPANWVPREPDPGALRSLTGHEGFS
jgi:SAM-dependent methyltransferase